MRVADGGRRSVSGRAVGCAWSGLSGCGGGGEVGGPGEVFWMDCCEETGGLALLGDVVTA